MTMLMLTRAELDAKLGQARAEERQRIRQLAIEKRAVVFTCTMRPCPDSHHSQPFADLLDGQDGNADA